MHTAHNPQAARQHSRTDPPRIRSQQANHNNIPNVVGRLLPGLRSKAKRVRGYFTMMPSKMRLEVRSQYNLKFDPIASTLDAPQRPWEAQRPLGVELSSSLYIALADLCCRVLDCRHVYIVLNGPQLAALRRFSPAFHFSGQKRITKAKRTNRLCYFREKRGRVQTQDTRDKQKPK